MESRSQTPRQRHDRRRSHEFLNLYLEKNNPNNRATRQLAEKIRSRRELDIDIEAHGFAPQHRRKENFIAYFTTLADNREGRTKTNWHKKPENYYAARKNLVNSPSGRVIAFIAYLLKNAGDDIKHESAVLCERR